MMSKSELLNTAKEWVDLCYLPEDSSERTNKFWAYTMLCDLCHDEPEQCWEAIHIIRQIDGSDIVLSNLAASLMEDLLNYHGASFIDRIEKIARTDQEFSKLLGAVWQRDIPDYIWARVKTVAAQPW